MTPGLESKLHDLHQHLAWPVDDVELGWSARHVEVGALRGRARRLTVAVATICVFALVFIVSPQARQAVADLFEAAGIRVSFSEEPQAAGADLELGTQIDPEAAVARIGFPVRIPTGTLPGRPDAVYLDADGVLSMVWVGGQELPASGAAGIGLLFSQWSDGTPGFRQGKTLDPNSTTVTAVMVDGNRGLWVEGSVHAITLFDSLGNEKEETTRLAANVLIWDRDGVNYRIETRGNLQEALDLVESLEFLTG